MALGLVEFLLAHCFEIFGGLVLVFAPLIFFGLSPLGLCVLLLRPHLVHCLFRPPPDVCFSPCVSATPSSVMAILLFILIRFLLVFLLDLVPLFIVKSLCCVFLIVFVLISACICQ